MSDEAREIEEWKRFVSERGIKSIDIPYSVVVGAVNIVGVFHLREPFEESSTDGLIAGVVVGSYSLDRNRTEVRAYDPSGQFFRLVVQLDFGGRELKARLDTRKWDGSWSKGSWAVLWRAG